MTSTTNMQVSVRDLPQTRDIELTPSFVGRTLAEMPIRAALEQPADDPRAGHAHAVVELYMNEDAHVFARGKLRGWFTVACSRCVESVRVDMDEPLMVTYLPKNQMLAHGDEDQVMDSEEGIELSEEDLDVCSYEDDIIDLEPLLREQLILAVPFAPLCSESCKGLCPQCGANRNFEQCACEPVIDPRLSALRNIKL